MNDCCGHLLRFVVFRRLDDDTVTHDRWVARLRITFVPEPYLLVEQHCNNRALGRLDFDVFGIDGRHDAQYMKIGTINQDGGEQQQTYGQREPEDHRSGFFRNTIPITKRAITIISGPVHDLSSPFTIQILRSEYHRLNGRGRVAEN